jgi:hypothetical protein
VQTPPNIWQFDLRRRMADDVAALVGSDVLASGGPSTGVVNVGPAGAAREEWGPEGEEGEEDAAWDDEEWEPEP